jgi:hypothetical protein
VLRGGGALAVAGTLTSTAGCLGDLPLSGSATEEPPASPRRWLAPPSDLPVAPGFRYTGLEQLRAHRRHLSDRLTRALENLGPVSSAAGLDPEARDAYLRNAPVSVIPASFDRDRAVAALTDEAFEDGGEHEGFRLLVGEGRTFGSIVVGVGTDTLVWAQGAIPDDAPPGADTVTEVVEAAVDVGTGNGTRRVDVDADLALLLDAVGVDAVLWGRTTSAVGETDLERNRIEGQVAQGFNLAANGAESLLREAFVFDDEDDTDVQAVQSWLTSEGMTFADAVDDPDVSRDGRVVVVEGTMPTDEFM